MKWEHSGPVFPSGIQPTGYTSEGSAFEYGMTLRDYFAGQALAGWLANSVMCQGYSPNSEYARQAYDLADAMIAARSGHGRPTGEA